MRDQSERDRGFRGWRRLALVTAIATYLLIVLGGVVRITESGMGCGPDWPLCDGHLIPPMDFETLLEYGHRLVAAGVGLLIVALTVWAWKPGRTAALRASSTGSMGSAGSMGSSGSSGSSGVTPPAVDRAAVTRARAWRSLRIITAIAVVLVVIQSLLGAITVWLHLPRGTVILHLSAAMALLALLAIACCRSYAPGRVPELDEDVVESDLNRASSEQAGSTRRRLDRPARWAWAGVGFGAVVVLFGALVANLGAAPACQGFPLCNDAWLPADNPLVQIHWAHRMLAYAFVAWAVALPPLTRRWRPVDRPAATAARWVGGLTLLQVVVAAAMVLYGLPETLQALHLAVGGAIFAALVVHGWLVAHPAVARVRTSAEARVPGAGARVAAVPT